MSHPDTRRFAARLAELPALLDAARAACRAAHLDVAATHRVELVLEEAFSNSVRHGYGGDCAAPVWMSCRILPEGLEVVYEDAAPPFDPLANARLPERGQVGGLGRVLMKALATECHYAFDNDRNRLQLVFRRTPA